jgi:hypothetical protein
MGRFDVLTQLDEKQPLVNKKKTTGETVNELDNSSKKLSPTPLPEKPPLQAAQDTEQKQDTLYPVPYSEANNRPVRPRHAFDIYQDQYEDLLELSMEERRQGGTGSMSAMVREALDKFITERKRK